tara:strand:+ start:75 stop:926 length:852 start_codon:yes stop_codon:yes gene_type:complete
MTHLTSDFEKLAKTFDLETNGTQVSATIIFQLLLLKHGRRNAFALYDRENYFEGDDWLNCEIPSTVQNGDNIRLKELKEVAESFGFSLIREYKPTKMEFNHEMIKKEVSVSDTIIQDLEDRMDAGKNATIWILKKELVPKVAAFTGTNIPTGYLLEYPDCCISNFVNQKTQFLVDCMTEFYIEFPSNVLNRDPTDQELKAYCFKNYHNENVLDYEKRMEDINKLAKDSRKFFPFISHHACKNCIDDPQSSPSAKLNKTYADFARQIDDTLFKFFNENGIRTNL